MKAEPNTDADLYAILGVENSATPDEVRRAYKQRALETHPDKLNLDAGCSAEEKEEAEQRFRTVYEAFVVLGDTEKRKTYDIAHGFTSRADLAQKWASLSTQSLQRAQERQAWADEQEARYRARMTALREAAKLERAVMGEEWQRGREDREMVSRMLSSLCGLGVDGSGKAKTKGKVAAGKTRTTSSKKKRVVSEPAVKTGTQDKEGIQTPVASTQGLEVP